MSVFFLIFSPKNLQHYCIRSDYIDSINLFSFKRSLDTPNTSSKASIILFLCSIEHFQHVRHPQHDCREIHSTGQQDVGGACGTRRHWASARLAMMAAVAFNQWAAREPNARPSGERATLPAFTRKKIPDSTFLGPPVFFCLAALSFGNVYWGPYPFVRWFCAGGCVVLCFSLLWCGPRKLAKCWLTS